jgi:hypothetical protein
MYNLQNSSKIETTTTIPKGCQPLPRVKGKDKDSDSSTINISLFESRLKTELISEYCQLNVDYSVREAVRHNKNNLAYVEGICKKRKEKESDKVKRNATIDWTIRESARAKLMVLVKRTLTKYGYPPDKQQKAIDTVLRQAELLADSLVSI